MDYLEIQNADDRRVGITQVHAFEIQEYLRALDLIVEYDVQTIVPNAEPLKDTVFAQPGMRYCQGPPEPCRYRATVWEDCPSLRALQGDRW